jgi:hypothetical protein
MSFLTLAFISFIFIVFNILPYFVCEKTTKKKFQLSTTHEIKFNHDEKKINKSNLIIKIMMSKTEEKNEWNEKFEC